MKIVGIIPARFASSRFPGKPLELLAGKPLLQWVIELVRKCNTLSDFYVATDHEGIADLCRKLNAKVLMTSKDALTGTDRIFEACQKLKKQGLNFDVVINIQGDEPLLPVDYVDALARSFETDSKLQMATLAHPLDSSDLENENAVKVSVDENRFAIKFSRKPFSAVLLQKHIGLYGYRISFLEKFCQQPQSESEKKESLEQLRAMDMGIKIKVLSVSRPTYGVDTPEDLKKIEKVLKNEKQKYY